MTSVGLVREKTFEDIIKSKGVTVEAPFRPFTELQHDPHVMAFNLRASLDEIREMELRAQLHRRRMEDIREAAARQGIPLGAYMAQMPPIPRQNSAHMAVDPEYNEKVELSEEEREARIRELHESLARNRAQAAADVESAANANPTLTEQVADAAGAIGGEAGAAFGAEHTPTAPHLGRRAGRVFGTAVARGTVHGVSKVAQGAVNLAHGVKRESTKAVNLAAENKARRQAAGEQRTEEL